MKMMIIALAFSLILATNALALQQIAGVIRISTPVGGSNTSQYGLINDGNETVTIGLKAEGDIANYISFPESVELLPGKIVYTNITATIPSEYNTSLGMNITGYLYALQQGIPGQVQIDIQMKKSVFIEVYQNKEDTSPITAFFVFITQNSLPIALVIIFFVSIALLVKKIGGKKHESNISSISDNSNVIS
jgi:hypothetical protein